LPGAEVGFVRVNSEDEVVKRWVEQCGGAIGRGYEVVFQDGEQILTSAGGNRGENSPCQPKWQSNPERIGSLQVGEHASEQRL